ncbi:hypothetical protein QBC43DRAFT_352555 [Cladorrhinum sp. PSN259]|nr:hypothetical protein QBC43DRAFT_352555 [Cladorrhinum sp. PSN259]
MSASTALAARHAAIRSSIRAKPQVTLKIKTSSLDLGPSEEKAQAMAAPDWRKGGIKRRSEENDRRSSSLASSAFEHPPSEMELEELSPVVTYHCPIKTNAEWEEITSAPAWKLPPSVSSSASGSGAAVSSSSRSFGLGGFGPKLEDVTVVQLKDIEPLVVRFNGENVRLRNQLCLDITPIVSQGDWELVDFGELDQNSRRPVLGALRKITERTRVRRLTSEESYNTLEDLRQIFTHDRAVLVRHCIEEEAPSEKSSEDRRSGDSGISGISNHEMKEQGKSFPKSEESADQERFQKMLSRLRLQAPGAQSRTRTQPSASKTQAVYTAIIATKPKESSNIKDPWQKNNTKTFFGRDPRLLFTTDTKRLGDSGYGSFHFGRDSDKFRSSDSVDHPQQATRSGKEPSRSSASATSKKLNPAAAEFKSAAKGDPVLVISPKKITRAPLTNIFPHVMGDVAASSQPMIPSRVNGFPPPPMWSPERKPAAPPVPMVPIPLMVPSSNTMYSSLGQTMPFIPPPNNSFGTLLTTPPGVAPILNPYINQQSPFNTFPSLQPPPAPRPAFAQLASRQPPADVTPPVVTAPAPIAPVPPVEAPTLYGPA